MPLFRDPGSTIQWFDSLDSTNDELRRQIDTLGNLSAIAAREQTKGRGQGDHKWHSVPGSNLTCSVLLRYYEGFWKISCSESLVELNRYVTSVIVKFLETEGVKAWVKLPNDIWIDDKKICGILIENILDHGEVRESIVGIGLNLNETEFPEDLPNPVSLKQITGKDYSPAGVLEKLLVLFEVEPVFPIR